MATLHYRHNTSECPPLIPDLVKTPLTLWGTEASPRWPHHMCTASTFSSLRQLCADFCCFRHCVMLVHNVVFRWHDIPSFRFRESKDVTLEGVIHILLCTVHMKLETI